MSRTAALLIAHRGERIQAPENTIAGCRLAMEQGASGLEVDVRICGSGEIVLFHDLHLLKHFNRLQLVSLSSLKSLQSLRFNGSYKQPDRICTLEEFLEEFRHTVPINLDAKAHTIFNRAFAATLVKLIQRHGIHDQVWVSSFNPFLLRSLKSLDRRVRTGYLFQNPPRLHEWIDVLLSTDAWHPHHKNVTDYLMKKAARLHKEVYIWTVNRPEVLKKVQHYRYHGIITDVYFRNGSQPECLPSTAENR